MEDLARNITTMLDEIDANRQADAEYVEQMDRDMCMICSEKGYDRRTLIIDMFYNLKEVSDVFKYHPELEHYIVRMCKGCRSALMTKLAEWIQEGGRLKYDNLDDSGILSFSTKEELLAYKRGIA